MRYSDLGPCQHLCTRQALLTGPHKNIRIVIRATASTTTRTTRTTTTNDKDNWYTSDDDDDYNNAGDHYETRTTTTTTRTEGLSNYNLSTSPPLIMRAIEKCILQQSGLWIRKIWILGHFTQSPDRIPVLPTKNLIIALSSRLCLGGKTWEQKLDMTADPKDRWVFSTR